ncbi:MAG TPA: pirin family protein, partial [Clostridiaceae bacterium]|nr:pirin family protein [Clostridiaceae bacterium]
MMKKLVRSIGKMGFSLEVSDPFLACMHHRDDYPEGNEEMGPDPSLLEGRRLGADFDPNEDWRMYHGKTVPGFPAHPHRGFETVTVVLEGLIDHSDSHGASGRYGNGDVQWMTAGSGMQHAEMFPLLQDDKRNPLELFQVWLNLPRERKLCEPNYRMLWSEEIPVVEIKDGSGKKSLITLVAGAFGDQRSPDPAPDSWAYDRKNHVGIMLITMDPEAELKLPKISPTLNRRLYVYEGDGISICDTLIRSSHFAVLEGDEEIPIHNGKKETRILVLEGEPIGEPVEQYGPFVMNTREEI